MNLGILLSIAMAILTGIGQLFFKKAALDHSGEGNAFWQYLFSPWFYGALVTFGIATIAWMKALEFGSISKLFPLTAFSYLIIAVAAYYFFQERLSIINIIGMGVIIVGSIMINYGK